MMKVGSSWLWFSVVLVVAPGAGAAAPIFPDEPFRAQAPEPEPARPLRLPTIERARLGNGLALHVFSRPTLPRVQATLVMPGGTRSDRKGKEGVAAVCTSLLLRGTQTLNRSAYQAALTDLGAEVSTRANDESFELSLQVLRANLGPALDLWRDTLLRPALDEQELAAIVANRTAQLHTDRRQPLSPQALAARVTDKVLRAGDGRAPSAASLSAITSDDCRRLLATWARPGTAHLFIGGAISRAEAIHELGSRLGAWRSAGSLRRRAPSAPVRAGQRTRAQIHFVQVPDVPQTVVQLFHAGPNRTTRDFAAIQVMASIVGGRPTGRLMRRLRNELGYTYSITAGYSYQRGLGTFGVRAAVKQDIAIAALGEIDRVLRDYVASGPTDDEVVRERDGMLHAIPARVATVAGVLGNAQSALSDNLPVDHLARLARDLRRVGRADVARAARQHLRPDEMQMVVVGSATLLPDLRAAAASGKLGAARSIILLDADGNPLSEEGGLARLPQ